MSGQANREGPIVEALLGMPPEERGAYLEQACAEDPQLRQLVEAMLRAHEQGASLLDRRLGPATRSAVVTAPSVSEKPGDRIGRYKLLQQIGEGGCGIVYMAEQSEPMRRRVALKVIKLGMDTKQVIARFEAERQALAMMEHPNIAKVLDGGITETGRPFFVMELVRGITITRYCDGHRLNTAQRLDLFTVVCQAIQHAHQKGVVHRDIKPSNVLVADHDGVPVPKVIDFGIAKATAGQPLTDKTLFTAFEQFIGTPAYMSPEQAQLSGLDIDARSDVYSLGVLLYELLTGKTPFDPKRLVKAGLDEVRRIIREEDPPRPSTRLSNLDLKEQTTLARDRQSEPPKLLGGIRGDLDWIVMKTLEKDRNRRYETADGLAKDIKRHLSNQPVLARPPSNAYRFRKLVLRNRVAFTVGIALGFAVILGMVAAGLIGFAVKAIRPNQTGPPPAPIRVAVLPFSNASPGQVEEYLTDSLSTELIRVLGKVPGISAFHPPAFLTTRSLVELNTALLQSEVPFLVEGTVRWTEGKVSMVISLRETRVGAQIVSTNYTRQANNVMGVPNEMALYIAEHSLSRLSAEIRDRIRKIPTQNPLAYDYYLRGMVEFRGLIVNPGSNTIPMLEQAVALDDQFALAYAALSRAYVTRYFYTKPEETAALERKARSTFTRALELEPELAEAHYAKAFFCWTPSQTWQVREAIHEDRRALELNPNSRDVLSHLSLIYLHLGLFEEGLDLAVQGSKINPLDVNTHGLEANALFWQGKNSEAVDTWRAVRDRFGTNFIMNSYVAMALINLGRTNEAASLIHSALEADPTDTGSLLASAQAVLLAKQGDETGAVMKISKVLEHRKGFGHFHHALYNIASAYALLNKQELALRYLREAATDGFPCYPFFEKDSNLSNLRTNGGFRAFLSDQKKVYEKTKTEFGRTSVH